MINVSDAIQGIFEYV